MLTTLYLGAVCLFALIAVAHWRFGIYLALLTDVIRDPIRKLDADESVIITVAGAVVWAGILLGMLLSDGRTVTYFLNNLKPLRVSAQLLIAAIIPGALLSCVLYDRGIALAAVGAASLLGPMLGLLVGMAFISTYKQHLNVLGFFCLINSLAFMFNFAELWNYDWEVLGGLRDMEWVRYRTGYTIDLIGGIYRSPDIMGLHAAYAAIFGIYLFLTTKSQLRWAWLLAIVWALVHVVLCGRRKMIAMPLVFMVTWLLMSYYYGSRQSSRVRGPLIAVCMAALAASVYALGRAELTEEYGSYALTTFTEGSERLQRNVVGGVFETLRQSGVFGEGLGTSTQGRYYLGVNSPRAWQEDGISRLFIELGVPGVLLVLASGLYFLALARMSLRVLPLYHHKCRSLFGLWSIMAASVASYIVSHQHFSGDPVLAFFAVMFAGMAIGLPYWTRNEDMLARGMTRPKGPVRRTPVVPPVPRPSL